MASTFFFVLVLAASTAARTINLGSETSEDRVNLDEYGPYYQGDMRFGEGQLEEAKSGILRESYRWPNATVRFEIDQGFEPFEKTIIARGMGHIMKKTCIRFRNRLASDRDYIYVGKEKPGCWSFTGRQGGKQNLNLQQGGCVHGGTVAHEFIHALGFYHEQSRPDRDDYVQILEGNIQPEHEHNFDKYKKNSVSTYGVPYDYRSLMHYDDHAFSKNGQPTIVPVKSGVSGKDLGQRLYVTDYDAKKINIMYGCPQ